MEHLSHLVGAYSRIIQLDCLFAYLFRILSPLCFRRICLFAMSADIPLRSAARESHLPLLCCCSAFRAFLLFLFHASIISLLLTFCQLPDLIYSKTLFYIIKTQLIKKYFLLFGRNNLSKTGCCIQVSGFSIGQTQGRSIVAEKSHFPYPCMQQSL